MGYISYTESYSGGEDVTDVFINAFRGRDRRVIAGYTVPLHRGNYQGVWYGLYEIDEIPVRIVALVCPIDCFHGQGEHAVTGRGFGFKDMEESMGPRFYDMPEHLFRRLTPLDLTSHYAREWRLKVAEKLKIKAAKALDYAEQMEFAF